MPYLHYVPSLRGQPHLFILQVGWRLNVLSHQSKLGQDCTSPVAMPNPSPYRCGFVPTPHTLCMGGGVPPACRRHRIPTPPCRHSSRLPFTIGISISKQRPSTSPPDSPDHLRPGGLLLPVAPVGVVLGPVARNPPAGPHPRGACSRPPVHAGGCGVRGLFTHEQNQG